jgi:hypothetical protein
MATRTGDSDSDKRTKRANHEVIDPIFIQYIVTQQKWNLQKEFVRCSAWKNMACKGA